MAESAPVGRSRADPGETRADRIRRRVADNPVGAILVLAVAVIGALGGVVAGVREIADVFDGSSQRPAVMQTAVRLRPSELKTAANERFGFSFQYPVTWERRDPVNGDGVAAIGPQPGLVVTAYGALSSVGGPRASPFGYERVDFLVRQLVDATRSRLVAHATQQNVTWARAGGETSEILGERFVMETGAREDQPAVTSVALVTSAGERDVTMICQVPTRLYPSWRGACNQLLATLTLTR